MAWTAQWAIQLLGGDARKGMAEGVGSPLAMTMVWGAIAGCSVGHLGWRDDLHSGIAIERSIEPEGSVLVFLISVGYSLMTYLEAFLPDEQAQEETAEAIRKAENNSDDVALGTAYLAHGLVLSRRGTGIDREKVLIFYAEAAKCISSSAFSRP